jgi:UMF1 family MFS transporter
MPLIGAIADRTGRKRDIMLSCGWFGAAACIAMVFVGRVDWQLGAVLYALAFLGYSCSIVVSYSLLVDLSTPEDRDRVSSTGWALAYVGGGTLLAMSFVLSLFVDKGTLLGRRCARPACGGCSGRFRSSCACRGSSARAFA